MLFRNSWVNECKICGIFFLQALKKKIFSEILLERYQMYSETLKNSFLSLKSPFFTTNAWNLVCRYLIMQEKRIFWNFQKMVKFGLFARFLVFCTFLYFRWFRAPRGPIKPKFMSKILCFYAFVEYAKISKIMFLKN